ncbi:hypothetical protein [Pantoea agglomerans]|uniref:hypothetical protein n=1 Tax=Enterobacter agglomerans TaxID=549 RepID=UPI0010C1A10C|nr:hypothetical protein [Pantoea agglomerans]TKK33220.1 hypothetical protein PagCFBP13532_14455 [Pantoea agglomerans]
MARSRNIKPGFFTNDELAECSPLARLLFAGLWTIADKEGRLDDRPKKIKALVLPFDNVNCDDCLKQLHDRQFINRYSVEGNAYIQIANWKKHQNPHCKEAASEIPEQCESQPEPEQAPVKHDTDSVNEQVKDPQHVEIKEAPEKHSAGTVQEPVENNLNPADSLNLIPDSLNLIPYNTQAADATCEGEGQATVHAMSGRYAFEGNIVRLNHKDYEAWKLLYPNIDLNYELQKLDIEFTHEKPKNWFITASQKLSYQNKQATSRPAQPARRAVNENFAAKNYGTTEMPAWMEG